MGPMCLSLLCLVPLRIMVVLMVLALISTEWVTAQLMHSSKSSEICCYHSRVDSQISTTTSRPSVKPWELSPPELPVLNRPLLNALVAKMALFAAVEQNVSTLTENVSSLTARTCQIEANATSVSSGSGWASSWNLFGQKATAPQPLGPLGPMARGRLTTTETQDADLILSQAQTMNMHEVPFCYTFRVNNTTLECLLGSRSAGQRPTHQSSTSLLEFIAKTGSPSATLVFETRAKCHDFVAQYKDDGILCEVTSSLLQD